MHDPSSQLGIDQKATASAACSPTVSSSSCSYPQVPNEFRSGLTTHIWKSNKTVPLLQDSCAQWHKTLPTFLGEPSSVKATSKRRWREAGVPEALCSGPVSPLRLFEESKLEWLIGACTRLSFNPRVGAPFRQFNPQRYPIVRASQATGLTDRPSVCVCAFAFRLNRDTRQHRTGLTSLCPFVCSVAVFFMRRKFIFRPTLIRASGAALAEAKAERKVSPTFNSTRARQATAPLSGPQAGAPFTVKAKANREVETRENILQIRKKT